MDGWISLCNIGKIENRGILQSLGWRGSCKGLWNYYGMFKRLASKLNRYCMENKLIHFESNLSSVQTP